MKNSTLKSKSFFERPYLTCHTHSEEICFIISCDVFAHAAVSLGEVWITIKLQSYFIIPLWLEMMRFPNQHTQVKRTGCVWEISRISPSVVLLLIPRWCHETLIVFLKRVCVRRGSYGSGLDPTSVWRVWQAVGGLWAALIVLVPLRL